MSEKVIPELTKKLQTLDRAVRKGEIGSSQAAKLKSDVKRLLAKRGIR